MEWLPNTNVNEVIGLLEIVNDNDGTIALDDLHNTTGIDVDDLLFVVDAGEMLGFITVEKHRIHLTKKGKNFLSLDPDKRKEELSKYIADLDIFKFLFKEFMKRGGEMSYSEFLHLIKGYTNNKSAEKEVLNILHWGQYAGILDYDPTTKRIVVL